MTFADFRGINAPNHDYFRATKIILLNMELQRYVTPLYSIFHHTDVMDVSKLKSTENGKRQSNN